MKDTHSDFFEERTSKSLTTLEEFLDILPVFCRDYFVGIEMVTAPLTRVNYARDLRVFFDYLVRKHPKFVGLEINEISLEKVAQINANDIRYYLSYLSRYKLDGCVHTNTEKGKARKLSAVKSLFKYLYTNDLIPENVTAKVAHPKIHTKEIVRLDENEVNDILEVIESFNSLNSDHQNKYNDNTRLRDLAIITLLLGTGIRVSECVGLNIGDIDFNDNAFVVTRKGGNRTTLFFSDEIKNVLADYLSIRNSDNEPDNAPLFLSLQNKRITVRAVEYIVKKYAKIIAPLKRITPHKLRSTYGTSLYRATKDIYVVAEVLGHKDINTTKKHYAALDEDIKRAAASIVKLKSTDE